MQPLTAIPLAGHAILLPPGWDHASAQPVLAALLAEATGPESAGLFATAMPEGSELLFTAPDGPIARFAELDTAGRELLRSEIGRLTSRLRRAAARAAQRDPAGSGHLPALVAAAIELPSFEFVFAHAGRPLLAGWGMTPANAPGGLGLVRALDDGQPASQPRPVPWAALGAGLLALALLGGVAAMAAPWITGLVAPGPGICRIERSDLDAMLALMREKEREELLRRRLASLEEELGRRRAACPLPEPPPQAAAPEPPPPPEPRPEPEPPPPPPPPPRPPERPPERPSQPPPNTQPCNTDTQSGGRGITETRHYLGPTPGRVTMTYDTRREPDRIRVYQQGRLLAETPSFVAGDGTLSFDWNPPRGSTPDDHVVTVEVTGTPGSRSTVWTYRLHCPAGGVRR